MGGKDINGLLVGDTSQKVIAFRSLRLQHFYYSLSSWNSCLMYKQSRQQCKYDQLFHSLSLSHDSAYDATPQTTLLSESMYWTPLRMRGTSLRFQNYPVLGITRCSRPHRPIQPVLSISQEFEVRSLGDEACNSLLKTAYTIANATYLHPLLNLTLSFMQMQTVHLCVHRCAVVLLQ